MTARRALWGVVLGSTLVRLALAVCLQPGNDEAYHYLFTVHRDLSYFDHPPMVAIVERVGLSLTGGTASVLALRLGFLLLFAGTTLLMARLTTRFYGPWAGVAAAFILNVTGAGLAAGTFAVPDGPLLFFWLLTLNALDKAVQDPRRLLPWVVVGLAWGCALLSKYHAIFLPAGAALYFLLEPSARSCWRRPGPYLAVALGMLVFTPVIWWNATHGWASFAFQGGRAVGELDFRIDRFAVALGGQALYLFPWIWLGYMFILWRRRAHLFQNGYPADRFLLCQSVFPLVVFLGIAWVRPVLPHWSLIGLLNLTPMLGQAWAERTTVEPVRMRRRLALCAILPVFLVILVTVHARWGFLQKGGNYIWGVLPPRFDPTVDLVQWQQTAQELERQGLNNLPNTFVFTGKWYNSGQLAFNLAAPETVLCYNQRDARGFAYWTQPKEWVGHDGILVAADNDSTDPRDYAPWFQRIDLIGEFPVVRAGTAISRVRLFRCVHQTRAFTFDMPGVAPVVESVIGNRSQGKVK